jgi:hypothetical protein
MVWSDDKPSSLIYLPSLCNGLNGCQYEKVRGSFHREEGRLEIHESPVPADHLAAKDYSPLPWQ